MSFPMNPDSEAKRSIRPDQPALERGLSVPSDPWATLRAETLDRMQTALAKCTDLMGRHLLAGEKTVPARALYFILRDAGFGTSPVEKQQIKQTPKQEQQTDRLHHNYGIKR